MEEAIDILSGRVTGDLKDVALTLGAHILRNAGAAKTVEEGMKMLDAKIASGEGLKKFAEMIEAQGGDPKVCYDTGSNKTFNSVRDADKATISALAYSVLSCKRQDFF